MGPLSPPKTPAGPLPAGGGTFSPMPLKTPLPSARSAPTGFSWLSPAYRPSTHEVETYARIITAADGDPPEMAERHLHEAELQLWIWRNETRQPPQRVRRAMSDKSDKVRR